MKSKMWATGGERTFVLVCEKDDDPIAAITRLAREHRIAGASFKAIGAFREAVLAYFDPTELQYLHNPIDEQVEVVSLVGDIAQKDGEPRVHAHVVVACRDGSTRGGHLLGAKVWPTLEVVLTETPAPLRKRSDPETGLALIDLSA
jgi:predicted DNA-binding protein with PD1-like motif